MNIVEEIKEISDKLDEIDNYNSGLGQQLSIIDKKQQDILHTQEDSCNFFLNEKQERISVVRNAEK